MSSRQPFPSQSPKAFTPFRLEPYWHPSKGEPPERVYSEIYTANAWNNEYDEINKSHHGKDGPNQDLEAFIIGILLWSDSTVLAQFGTASLWPIYLYIGNQSKYTRAKPTSMSAHHLAYLPKVHGCVISIVITTNSFSAW
jgi:Plavaka transposase